MKKIIELLFGENQNFLIIALMLIPSISFFVFILWVFPFSLNTFLTAIFALDIFAGLMSNLQPQTNQAWKKQSNLFRQMFVIFHLTIYPFLVVLFQVSVPLMVLILVMLLTKTTAFIIGTKHFLR